MRIISKKHRVDIGAQPPIPRAPKEAALPRLIVARVLAQDGRKNRAHHKVLDHAVAGSVPTELLNRVDINLDGGLGVLRRRSSSSMIWRRRVTGSSSSATQNSSDHVDRRLRNTRKRPPQSGYTHKRIL